MLVAGLAHGLRGPAEPALLVALAGSRRAAIRVRGILAVGIVELALGAPDDAAGSGPDGSPRAALNAASCSANDFVGLKNRNGFSTSQIRSAARLELLKRLLLVARLVNRVTAQAAARA